MGRPDVTRIKRDADVATAEAERDAAIKRAEAMRAAAVAKSLADQERVLAEALSQAKLAEAQAKSDVLIAQHRRARALNKAGDARLAVGNASHADAFDRMRGKVQRDEALSQAKAELAGDSMEDRLASLEKEQEVTRLLTELKARRGM
jgi:phage shock protein A